jgi:hypothetical protein
MYKPVFIWVWGNCSKICGLIERANLKKSVVEGLMLDFSDLSVGFAD